jgi:hypothetical protein
MTASALPEVRQCQDDTNYLFGAVAVRTTMPDGWGVMSVANGGHHSTDEEVADWAVIQPPATTRVGGSE